MKIKTKFNLENTVYPIKRHGYNGFIKCKTCNGRGKVSINNTNKEFTCPDYYGIGGKKEWMPDRWVVCTDKISSIGKIDVELYSKKYSKDNKNVFRYMIYSTGIGSGTLWDESDLFLTSKEANLECDNRNKITYE